MTVHRQTTFRSRILGTCLAVGLATATAACGGGDDAANGGSGSDSGSGGGSGAGSELETISATYATVGTPVVYGSIIPVVADELDLYEKFGIDVTLQNFANGADSVRAVIGGQVDAAITSTSSLVNVNGQGAEVLGTVGMDKPSYYLASSDPDITTCEDLDGQTIGVDQTGGARYNSTVTMLASCGLSVDDVTFVNFAGPPIIQALIQGQITVGNLHPDEGAFIEGTSDVELEKVMNLVDDVNPNTHYVVQVHTRDFIEENRDAAVRLAAVYIEANEWVRDPANSEELAAIASKHNGQPSEVAQEAVRLFLDFEFWPEGSGIEDEKKLLGVVQEQIAAGAITEAQAPTYEDLVDASIYEEALELIESIS